MLRKAFGGLGLDALALNSPTSAGPPRNPGVEIGRKKQEGDKNCGAVILVSP